MTNARKRHPLIDNFVWLLICLVLSVIVWVTAELDTDPIVEERIAERVEVQILTDPDMIVTNQPTNRVIVTARAQQSILAEIEPEDIEVTADARNVDDLGSQRIMLSGRVIGENRASVVEIVPSQIMVELNRREERFVPLTTRITNEPPANVEATIGTLDIRQVLISGPADAVAAVDEVRVPLDLSDLRESVSLEINPFPVDTDNNNQVIQGITMEPELVTVDVDIELRSDLREIRVTPNIIGEPPEGYTLTSGFSYSPETVFVSGSEDLLSMLPGTLFTEQIDLSQYTDDFEITVPVELPNERLVLITGQQITVSVGIDPIQTSRQFERIPVEIIGLDEDIDIALSPEEVSVLVNGPQPILSGLQASDVRVIVDLNSLSSAVESSEVPDNTFQVEPVATVGNGQLDEDSISVLPPTIDIQVLEPTG